MTKKSSLTTESRKQLIWECVSAVVVVDPSQQEIRKAADLVLDDVAAWHPRWKDWYFNASDRQLALVSKAIAKEVTLRQQSR
jgi:uncharacterized protein (UPF0261 family)